MTKIQNKLQEIKQKMSKNNAKTNECIVQIKKQGRNMKQEVDKITEGLTDECKKEKRLKKQRLKEKETILETKLEELQALIQQTEGKSGGDNQYIRNKIQAIKEDISVVCEDESDLDNNGVNLVFTPGDCDVTTLVQMFGRIQHKETEEDKSSDVEPIIEVKVISTFLSVEKVNSLAMVDSQEAWVSNKNCIKLLKSDGTEMKCVKLDFNIYSTVMTSKGEVLLGSQMNIKKLLPNGHLIDFIDNSPYSTNGMYVTSDGDILVCLYDWFKQDGKVDRFSYTGQKKQTIQFVKRVQGNLSLFTKPQYVTQTANGDVCVTNTDSKDSGSVIVTNKDGGLRFSYNGMNMKKPFYPHGVVSDKHGHVLILDTNNDVIHLVDQNGEFLNFLFTKDHGLLKPRIISGDQDGTVWISCDTNNKIIVAKYLA